MTTSRCGLLFVLLLGFATLAACSNKPPQNSGKNLVLKGAGSTFAAPLYRKWSDKYQTIKPSEMIEYEAVGSGQGQVRFLKEEVDFGATDVILSSDQRAEIKRGALMVPIASGCVVLAYNPDGLTDGLHLPRDVYVDIFLGKINSWDDPRIVAANPDVTLPSLPMQRVVRLDSSGTTVVFTSHLSAINKEWRKGPGVGKLVTWPNNFQREPGNEHVAGAIKVAQGGIGYVEFGAARASGLYMARLENKQGEFIQPTNESARLALSSVGNDAEQLASLHDPDVKGAYPITTCTWLLAYKHYEEPKRGEAVKEFVRWCLNEGQEFCEALGYVRLAPELAASALETIGQIRP